MKYIYSIKDPHLKEVFYIGATKNPEHRFSSHTNMNLLVPLYHRIKSILDMGLKLEFEILELCGEDWRERERFWINSYISLGNNLLNKQIKGKSSNKFTVINNLNKEDK